MAPLIRMMGGMLKDVLNFLQLLILVLLGFTGIRFGIGIRLGIGMAQARSVRGMGMACAAHPFVPVGPRRAPRVR